MSDFICRIAEYRPAGGHRSVREVDGDAAADALQGLHVQYHESRGGHEGSEACCGGIGSVRLLVSAIERSQLYQGKSVIIWVNVQVLAATTTGDLSELKSIKSNT